MIDLPPVGDVVSCKVQGAFGEPKDALLVHVNEDDVTWRTADDGSELDEWNWDVVSWKPITQMEVDND